MEYLPDGRPCKACTSAEDMIRMGQKFKNNKQKTSDGKLNDDVNNLKNNEKLRRSDCPVDKEQLGRSTWNLLHTISTYYPEKPAMSDKNNVKNLLTSLSNVKFYFLDKFNVSFLDLSL